ncbi:MAG: type I pullulanase [Pseudobutyrivibrio sp.]|nr:type I pullulanase [Pseudobutyrivibrio sp.]
MILYTGTIAEDFNRKYNYDGQLGLKVTEESIELRVWAPEADSVSVNIYESGDISDNAISTTIPMDYQEKGVFWTKIDKSYMGRFYTYMVYRNGEATEACDPYAKAVGVNGDRAAIIDLKATDPKGWENDTNPNAFLPANERVIYEAHVRDLTKSDSSNVKHKGLFKGVTESAAEDSKIGLNYIADLGVTHIQFLPIYDFGSVDEKNPGFNWGYDPKNYFAVEGSYSTDPYNPIARITELKEMIMACHNKGLSVVMDVVLNHVYDADSFCFNKIVPGYFSRIDSNGIYSNGSFCGNDTASERYMVSKYIVDNILYWAKEYHIDGFRFDLVGLIDVDTINELIEKVHAIRPDVIFHGEGWELPTVMTAVKPLATQMNADKTPELAYFDDVIRNLLRGDNFHPTEKGYCNGAKSMKSLLKTCLMGKRYYTSNCNQLINYVSCHDDYTLYDKFKVAGADLADDILYKQCMLAAGICFISKGTPLILNGEEFARTKVDEEGNIVSNSYKSSDFVNAIDWNELKDAKKQEMIKYYKALIAFKRNYANVKFEGFKDGIDDESLLINGSLGNKRIVILINPENKEVKYTLSEGTYNTILCSDSKLVSKQYEESVTVPSVAFMVLERK